MINLIHNNLLQLNYEISAVYNKQTSHKNGGSKIGKNCDSSLFEIENKKSGSVEVFLLLISNFMQNFRKIYAAVPEINCNGLTDGRTDGLGLIVCFELRSANIRAAGESQSITKIWTRDFID